MTIKPVLRALTLLFLGWVSVLLAVAAMTDEAPAYVVLFPGTAFMRDLPSDTSVVAASAYSVTLTSDAPGFAISLYRRGAWVVLPAGLTGCLPMPQMP